MGGISPTKVSVVIPCHNGEAFLEETLASVRAQTLAPDEIVVVDDASTDRSAEIAIRCGATCIPTGTNVGLPAARNFGIRHAKGSVIALLDADDIWLPDHLRSIVELLERYPDAGVAFARVQLFGVIEHEQEHVLPSGRPVDAFWNCVRDNIVIPSSCAIRREAWEAVGGFDESLWAAEDFDFFMRVSRRFPFVFTGTISVKYRKHQAQMTMQNRRIREFEYRSRERFWRQARANESPEFVRRLEAAMRDAWDERLGRAWTMRNGDLLKFYLTLGAHIPGPHPVFAKWRRRLRFMPVVRVWDHLPLGVRRGVRRSAAVMAGWARESRAKWFAPRQVPPARQ
jgi:glycosyltransferase involved in cell wall biosynthesis